LNIKDLVGKRVFGSCDSTRPPNGSITSLEQLQEPEINHSNPARSNPARNKKIAGVSPGESKLNKDGTRAYLQM
jgi:hypothetical protein